MMRAHKRRLMLAAGRLTPTMERTFRSLPASCPDVGQWREQMRPKVRRALATGEPLPPRLRAILASA
jgi:hypothetical protein